MRRTPALHCPPLLRLPFLRLPSATARRRLRAAFGAPALALALLAGAATAAADASPARTPHDAFFANLKTLCGQSHDGVMVAGDPVLDKDFAESALRLGPVVCSDDRVAIPFAVGDDQSRTWIVTRTPTGLQLKHRHAHGEVEDTLSRYGGDTRADGSPTRQDFPADAYSIALFQAENRPASVTNVWTIEIEPDQRFSYALRRPGRHVEVAFALTPPASKP